MSSTRSHTATLAGIVFLGVCNHVVLNGSRVVVALNALHLGGSTALVGSLLALFALLPMIFAVAAGRLADRIGVRRPMLAGSVGVGVGALAPLAVPGAASLFVAAALVGTGFMLFQVAAQRVTGELGQPSDRVANYAMLSLGFSISGFLGPLLAGFGIDRVGFRATFGALALVPVAPVLLLSLDRLRLPGRKADASERSPGHALELLGDRALRRILAINALFSLGWELHTVFVPIYGAQIGLSASAIGTILSAFAAATFTVRFTMPWLTRHAREDRVLAGALLLAGVVYLLFPFSRNATMLTALSFALGLGLGSGQPVVMSKLYVISPPGRMGEAAGLRMALIQALAVGVPLVFGAVGGSLGLLPVFWTVGILLAGGGMAAGKQRR